MNAIAKPVQTKAQRLLSEAIAAGLNFGEALNVFAEKRTPGELEIVAHAQDKHSREGEMEIDSTAQVSEGDDNGAYVLAWVWVPFDGTPFNKEPNT